MKRIRIMGLCFVAAFVLSVVGASSASAAEPEWAHCAKTKPAKFEDVNCTKTTGKLKYNIVPGLPCVATPGGRYKDKKCSKLAKKGKPGKFDHTFTAILPPGKFSTTPGTGLPPTKCEKGIGTGALSAPKGLEKVTLTFSECKTGPAPCTTVGQAAETIKTEALKGTLVYLSGKGTLTPKVGVDLESETTYFAEFACTGIGKLRVKGAVIGEVTGDINSLSTVSEFKFAGDGKGKQELTAEEGGVAGEDFLEGEASTGGPFASIGPASEETLVGVMQPLVEIKA